MLLSITKPQNLKAIHNRWNKGRLWRHNVINHKTTKFESNSQPTGYAYTTPPGCYQSQNYKFWKQFITPKASQIWAKLLLSITKLQILKAIHNYLWCKNISILVVINHKTTKFESNSQLYREHLLLSLVVINRKTTKFESKSQRATHTPARWPRCYQSQNCKIWKQFTTNVHFLSGGWTLLSITKLQNLKAIHNINV